MRQALPVCSCCCPRPHAAPTDWCYPNGDVGVDSVPAQPIRCQPCHRALLVERTHHGAMGEGGLLGWSPGGRGAGGWRVILGGILAHLCLGTLYTVSRSRGSLWLLRRGLCPARRLNLWRLSCLLGGQWGNLSVYVTSFLKIHHPHITYEDTIIIYGCQIGAQVRAPRRLHSPPEAARYLS